MIDWLMEHYIAIAVWSFVISLSVGLIGFVIYMIIYIQERKEFKEFRKKYGNKNN